MSTRQQVIATLATLAAEWVALHNDLDAARARYGCAPSMSPPYPELVGHASVVLERLAALAPVRDVAATEPGVAALLAEVLRAEAADAAECAEAHGVAS